MSTKGQVIRCLAAVLYKEGSALRVEQIEVDPPKNGEVRVKMVGAGLCATDAHFVWGWETDLKLDFEGLPVVLGHEGAGIVESVGDNVSTVKAGDKVMLMWMPECGQCLRCHNPKTNLCSDGDFQTTLYHKNRETRMRVNGKPVLSFCGTSTFSEYSVVSETQLSKLNPRADLKTVCIIGCAIGTGYGSATNIAKVHSGSKCAIWGLGAIGLSCVLGCKQLNAKEIIGIDLNEKKREIAMQMGCTRFESDSALELSEVDYAFDCIGNQMVLNKALNCLSQWGTLTAIGLAPKGSKVEIPVKGLLTGQTVTGGFFGNEKPRQFNQLLVEKHCSGELPIDPLISHRIKLKDINTGFDWLKKGQTIRTVIEFD